MATIPVINYAPRQPSGRLRPIKPAVTPGTPCDVIFHEGKVYEVPVPIVSYLRAIESFAIRERAASLGLDIDSRGVYGCSYCKHSPRNIQVLINRMLEEDLDMVMDANTDAGPSCRFPVSTTKVATAVTHKSTGIKYMAQEPPCAATVAKVSVLVEKGHLDDYLVDKPFDYPTFHQLDTDPRARQRYRVSGPGMDNTWAVTALPWWSRLVRLFRKE